MPLKSTMRYYLTPDRMAITEKNTNNKCWWGCGEKGTLVYCRWECKLMHLLWKTLCRFLRKLKVGLSYDPEILFLRYTKNVGERESHSVMSDSLQPQGLCSLWNSPGQNTGVGSLSLLQRIFLTQESNWGLLHCRWILY